MQAQGELAAERAQRVALEQSTGALQAEMTEFLDRELAVAQHLRERAESRAERERRKRKKLEERIRARRERKGDGRDEKVSKIEGMEPGAAKRVAEGGSRVGKEVGEGGLEQDQAAVDYFTRGAERGLPDVMAGEGAVGDSRAADQVGADEGRVEEGRAGMPSPVLAAADSLRPLADAGAAQQASKAEAATAGLAFEENLPASSQEGRPRSAGSARSGGEQSLPVGARGTSNAAGKMDQESGSVVGAGASHLEAAPSVGELLESLRKERGARLEASQSRDGLLGDLERERGKRLAAETWVRSLLEHRAAMERLVQSLKEVVLEKSGEVEQLNSRLGGLESGLHGRGVERVSGSGAFDEVALQEPGHVPRGAIVLDGEEDMLLGPPGLYMEEGAESDHDGPEKALEAGHFEKGGRETDKETVSRGEEKKAWDGEGKLRHELSFLGRQLEELRGSQEGLARRFGLGSGEGDRTREVETATADMEKQLEQPGNDKGGERTLEGNAVSGAVGTGNDGEAEPSHNRTGEVTEGGQVRADAKAKHEPLKGPAARAGEGGRTSGTDELNVLPKVGTDTKRSLNRAGAKAKPDGSKARMRATTRKLPASRRESKPAWTHRNGRSVIPTNTRSREAPPRPQYQESRARQVRTWPEWVLRKSQKNSLEEMQYAKVTLAHCRLECRGTTRFCS
jgi:hypothetical protein